MPIVDGFHALERLKEFPGTQCIPVIMLTARNDREDMLRGMISATDYITKPVTPKDLTTIVRKTLDCPNYHREVRRFSI